jgi:hypothetical protein
MDPLQKQQCELALEEILQISFNIRKAWLKSVSLYLQRAEEHNLLAHGTENVLLLHYTVGRPPDAPP